VHDWVNLVLVPLIGALTIAGLAGLIDPALVTYAFLAYVVGDFVWVWLQVRACLGKESKKERVRP
jgi:hypothetical protein